jgi:thioester reductase-like protein
MNVLITGATGFVGGELLVKLSQHPEVNKIFCLVRAKNEADAYLRLEHVFNFHHDYFDRCKVFPVIGNLFDDNLSSSLIDNPVLKDISIIIHSAANTSFSKIYDTMVEKTNIGGLIKILTWAKQLNSLKTFLYIGTATICGKDISNRTIMEEESPNLKANHLVKYTYTKMHGEILLHQYLPEDKILVARPSIIMGDSKNKNPRSPVILWALATIDLLRLVPINPHSKIDIIPVDYAAESIITLLFSKRNHLVYHISSGINSATTPFKVTKAIEKHFVNRPEYAFTDKALLNQMKLWAKNNLKPDSELYNYQKYLKYWEDMFVDVGNLRIILAGLGPYIDFIELSHVFDNTKLLQDTDVKSSIPADQYIVNSISYLDKIDVFEGAKDP